MEVSSGRGVAIANPAKVAVEAMAERDVAKGALAASEARAKQLEAEKLVGALGGHDMPCGFCGAKCSSLSGDPGHWPVLLPLGLGSNILAIRVAGDVDTAWYHRRCVADRLRKRDAEIDRLRQQKADADLRTQRKASEDGQTIAAMRRRAEPAEADWQATKAALAEAKQKVIATVEKAASATGLTFEQAVSGIEDIAAGRRDAVRGLASERTARTQAEADGDRWRGERNEALRQVGLGEAKLAASEAAAKRTREALEKAAADAVTLVMAFAETLPMTREVGEASPNGACIVLGSNVGELFRTALASTGAAEKPKCWRCGDHRFVCGPHGTGCVYERCGNNRRPCHDCAASPGTSAKEDPTCRGQHERCPNCDTIRDRSQP